MTNTQFKFTVSMNINTSYYVVYMHHTPDGELIYIGFDVMANLFRYHHLASSETWKRKVQEHGGKYTVSLYDTYATRVEAQRVASALKQQLKPATQFGNRRSSAIVRNIETGMHYISAACAAKIWDINPSVMSRHLRKDKGFNSVKGLTFERLYVNELPPETPITLPTGQVVPFGSTVQVKQVVQPPQPVASDKMLTEALLREMHERDGATQPYEQFKVAIVAALTGDGFVYVPDAPAAPQPGTPLYAPYKPDLRPRRDMSEEDLVQVHNHYLMEGKMPRFPPMMMDEFKQWLTDNNEWVD